MQMALFSFGRQLSLLTFSHQAHGITPATSSNTSNENTERTNKAQKIKNLVKEVCDENTIEL